MSRVVILSVAALAACTAPRKAERIPLGEIAVIGEAQLRTSPVGGSMDRDEIAARKKLGEDVLLIDNGRGDAAINASYVLVDAENRSADDAMVTLGGTLAGGDRTAKLKPESLFVPAGGTRTFLLLDDGLQPRPWATGVKVVVTGAMVAKYPPPMELTDVNVFTDGDHVVAAAIVRLTAKRRGKGLVHAAFHDANGKPLSRGHTVFVLEPGAQQTLQFVGPPGSRTATLFGGDAVF